MRIVIEKERDGHIIVWTDSRKPLEVVLLEHGGRMDGDVDVTIELPIGPEALDSCVVIGSVYPKEVFHNETLVERVMNVSHQLWGAP